MKQLAKNLRYERNLKKEILSLYNKDNPDPQVQLEIRWMWDDIETLNSRINLVKTIEKTGVMAVGIEVTGIPLKGDG